MDRFRYYENKFRAADKVTVLYQFIVFLIVLFNFSKIFYARIFISVQIVIITGILVLPFLGSKRILNWLRIWNQIVLIPFNFYELHFLVHRVHPRDMDSWLIKIDHALFGVNPIMWMEKLQKPLVTEYLQLVYASFYFIPLILIILLYRHSMMQEFDYFVFIIIFGFYTSYLIYFLVPAVGPRFSITALQKDPLKGIWLTGKIQYLLNSLENTQRDAFPSGHTAMTLLTMYFAYKFHKKYFYILLVIGTSLIFSTMYLRYHYVIDVIAGGLLAWAVVVTGPVFYRLLNSLPLVPVGRFRNVVKER